MFHYLFKVLKNYSFDGRARREEFWMFRLGVFVVACLLGIPGLILAFGGHLIGMVLCFILALFFLAGFVPSIAVIVRRLHDQGKSGSYFFVSFIPVVGGIWMLVLLCTEGTHGDNLYGPDPKAVPEQQV